MRLQQELIVACLAATASACLGYKGGDDDQDAAPIDAAEPIDGIDFADAGEQGVVWEPCPFYTYGGGLDAECTEVEVPFDWDDPEGDHLTLFLKRLGDVDISGQQVWFLMGGPGGASHGYESLAETLLGADPSLDIYLLDHRGTGRSTRLGCPVQEGDASDSGYSITMAEYPDCLASIEVQWGDNLDYFSTTMAARDLGWLIAETRAPGQKVHVHGGSYGTFWAQRYLQVHPSQPTSVSMLGVVRPTFTFTEYNQQYETVGAAYLTACGADSFCRSKLGPHPETTFRAVMDDIEGHCPEALAAGLDRVTLRTFFGGQLIWGWDERVLPLAIIYRIERCSAGDVAALEYLAANMVNPLDGLSNDRLFSAVLGSHIGLSDLWEEPIPTLAEANALLENALWAFGGTGRLELDPVWPKYAEDEFADVFADSSVPILMINGEFDPALPLAQALTVGDHFDGPNQHFVSIPGGSHSWTSPTTEGWGCALNIFYAFMQDAEAPLLDCVGDIIPLDFTGSDAMASLLGSADLWENAPAKAAPAPDSDLLGRVQRNFRRARTGRF